MPSQINDQVWTPYLERYHRGEWRGPVFRDLVLADAKAITQSRGLTFLDIGCGRGFDDDATLQRTLATAAASYVGVEPDAGIALQPIFTTVHHCPFEDAPIPPASVDIAFAVMVLEHLAEPQRFWDKVHEVLADGGIFWGFTMDARHWFVTASLLAKRTRIKDYYLNALHGGRGDGRYENYPVHYRSNAPEQILQYTHAFRSVDLLNFTRVGQMDYYFPRWLRPLGHALDRFAIRRGKPGSILAMRVEK